MQTGPIKDEDVAELYHQVEPVVSGPTKTKRGVGRLKKALSAPPEPPKDAETTFVVTHNGEVVWAAMAPLPKPMKNQVEPNFLTVETTVDGETVKKRKGPYWGSRVSRRRVILPLVHHGANKAAKASIRAKKAAMIKARRETPLVTKAEREALAVA